MHDQQMHKHRVLIFPTDIDECAAGLDSCDVNAGCANTDGSYECTCNSGYAGSGLSCSGNSHIRVFSMANGHTLPTSDVNECDLKIDNCAAEQMCVNTEGSHMCICRPGYSGPTCIGRCCLRFF